MKIKLLITGGTIDDIDYEKIEDINKYACKKTYIIEMLKQGKCKADIDSQILMMKDSIYMTDSDREKILKSCKNCQENKIVITHGTDTMPETARFLGENIKDKTVVLLGAIIPYNQKNSDALFNLGCAISVAQILPNGVYITMNGKIFPFDNVRKNKKLNEFEKIIK